jgi:hypothetical protein
VVCSTEGNDGLCAVNIYNAVHTFSAGDFIGMVVWARPADQSAGVYAGFNPTLWIKQGPALSTAYFYGSNSFNRGVNAYPLDGGSWQRVFGWTQVTQTGAVPVQIGLGFDPLHPMIYYAPAVYFFAGNQIPAPAAPAVSQSLGGALSPTTYYVRTTYVNATGETDVQPNDTTLPVEANNVLTVTSPPSVSGVTGWNVYVGNNGTCSVIGTSGPRPGDLTGPGETCEVKQNGPPLSVGINWTEPTTGLVPFTSWYVGANGPAGQTEPTSDSTNVYGVSEVASFMANVGSFNASCSVGQTCDMVGQIPHVNQPQTWTGTQTFDSVNAQSLNLQSETINGQVLDSVPLAIYGSVLPGPLNTPYIAATFTPPYGVVVMRIEITLKSGPQDCAANAIVRISGTDTWDLVLASSYSDSGPISLPMNVGTPIQVILETPSQGCAVPPQDGNVEVLYRMQ